MKPIIGEYYKDIINGRKGGETIQVKSIKEGIVYSRVVLDPRKTWFNSSIKCSLKNFFKYYKHIKYFNTPLYKAINL